MKPLPCMNPFQPKRAPPRKAVTLSSLQMDAAERAREFGADYHTAHLELDDNHKFYFKLEEASWINGNTGFCLKLIGNFKLKFFMLFERLDG